TGDEEGVFIAKLRADRFCFCARVACNDAVDESAGKKARVANPMSELFRKFPSFDEFFYEEPQLLAVAFDEFARQHDDSLVRISIEMPVPSVQPLRQFSGERGARPSLQRIAGIKRDTSFGGVRDDKAKVWPLGRFNPLIVVPEIG